MLCSCTIVFLTTCSSFLSQTMKSGRNMSGIFQLVRDNVGYDTVKAAIETPRGGRCIREEIEMSAGLMKLYIFFRKQNKTHADGNFSVFFPVFAGTALSALPKVLISKLFLCLGGPCNDGPTFAQPEE